MVKLLDLLAQCQSLVGPTQRVLWTIWIVMHILLYGPTSHPLLVLFDGHKSHFNLTLVDWGHFFSFFRRTNPMLHSPWTLQPITGLHHFEKSAYVLWQNQNHSLQTTHAKIYTPPETETPTQPDIFFGQKTSVKATTTKRTSPPAIHDNFMSPSKQPLLSECLTCLSTTLAAKKSRKAFIMSHYYISSSSSFHLRVPPATV